MQKKQMKKDTNRSDLLYKRKGITLIALVITIIVLLILAGVTISALSGDNGILTNASKAKYATELSQYNEELQLFKSNKVLENMNFEGGSLVSAENSLDYNTKPAEETGNIYNVIPSLEGSHFDGKLEVIKGELLLNSQDKTEIEVAQSVGVAVNPYEITDEGELISSNGNLLLMDEETGTLRLPESVTSIGEGAFANLDGLKKIIIPGTVKTIKTSAFSYNQSLEEVILENGVETIEINAFLGCGNLQKIEMPESVKSIGANCFKDCIKLDNVVLPSNLTTLQVQTFNGCKSLKSLKLSDNLEKIGSQCFTNCAIKELKFPKTLKKIDGSIFPSAIEFIDTSENDYYEFINGVLYTKDKVTLLFVISTLKTINIEDSVENISQNAFHLCTELKTIELPAKVKNIDILAFPQNTYTEIKVNPENEYFVVIDNNLYSKDGKVLYKSLDAGNIVIKDGVENIVLGAFYTDGRITGITLPESFIGDQYIEYNVFPTLNYLYLPKNVKSFYKYMYKQVKNIEVSSDNPYFKSINNEYVLSKDGTELYWVKSDLQDVKIPETVKVIKGYALQESKATYVKLPDSVTEIGTYVTYMSNIQKLEISSNIEKIVSYAFTGTQNLKEVIIHKEKNSVSGSPWGNPYGDRAIFWDNT